MDHQPTTFPLFPSLPAELRLMVYEHALLPLIETRIVEVFMSHDDPESPSDLEPDLDFIDDSFGVKNRTFLRETQSFVVSAKTLRQVRRESRAAVEAFHERYGRLRYQRGFFGNALFRLSRELNVSLRLQGPHADIFFWRGLRLLETESITSWSVAGHDLGLATRWLVPMGALIRDLHEMEEAWDPQFWKLPFIRAHSCIKDPLLWPREHVIIALVPANDLPSPLRHSDLIVVSAGGSRDVVIPGLEAGDRDLLLGKFEHCQESLRRFEEQRLSENSGPMGFLRRARQFPNLYFAYVDPLKRSKPRQTTRRG